MYGFLRANSCLLTHKDRETYKKLYCGQCAALHRLFGYSWRTLVSYDAAFLGILIAAQQDAYTQTTKSWCGVFPKKMTVCSPVELPSLFSACMAVIIFSLKIADARQEGRPYWKGWLEKRCSPGFQKARDILASLDFPVELFETISAEQQRIESSRRSDIATYAEPTARFLAEGFRFAAKVTKNTENEAALCEIGYNVGRIIYLIDSCIDILDDMGKKEFNALLAAYATDQDSVVSSDARTEITQMVMDSLSQISTSVKTLQLKRYQGIVKNILLGGFPTTIQHRVQRSVKKLEKESPLLLKYLPHAALASALCIFTSQSAEAARWVWGRTSKTEYAFGCESGYAIDVCCNPCVYYIPAFTYPDGSFNCTLLCSGPASLIQIPKLVVGVSGVYYASIIVYEKSLELAERIKQNRKIRHTEENKRKRQEATELRRKNQEYIDKAITDINSITSFFNTYPLDMGKKLIPQNFKDEFFNFAGKRQNEDLSANKDLKKMIAEKTEELRQLKSRFEDAMQVHKRALDTYESIKNAVNTSGNLSLIKELELDYAELTGDNLKSLLTDWRWDDFKEVVEAIDADMVRIENNMKNKITP